MLAFVIMIVPATLQFGGWSGLGLTGPPLSAAGASAGAGAGAGADEVGPVPLILVPARCMHVTRGCRPNSLYIGHKSVMYELRIYT